MKKKLAMLLAATMLVTLFIGCGAGRSTGRRPS